MNETRVNSNHLSSDMGLGQRTSCPSNVVALVLLPSFSSLIEGDLPQNCTQRGQRIFFRCFFMGLRAWAKIASFGSVAFRLLRLLPVLRFLWLSGCTWLVYFLPVLRLLHLSGRVPQ